MRALLGYLQMVAAVPARRYLHSKAFSAGPPARSAGSKTAKQDAKNPEEEKKGTQKKRVHDHAESIAAAPSEQHLCKSHNKGVNRYASRATHNVIVRSAVPITDEEV